jgi:hypothetical protein
MGQARPEMIAGAVKENLRLVLQPTKRARMNDARPVALKLSAISVAGLRVFSAPRFARPLCKWSEDAALGRVHFFSRPPARARTSGIRQMIRHAKHYSSPTSLCESGVDRIGISGAESSSILLGQNQSFIFFPLPSLLPVTRG